MASLKRDQALQCKDRNDGDTPSLGFAALSSSNSASTTTARDSFFGSSSTDRPSDKTDITNPVFGAGDCQAATATRVVPSNLLVVSVGLERRPQAQLNGLAKGLRLWAV
jgi:hypothetical protein